MKTLRENEKLMLIQKSIETTDTRNYFGIVKKKSLTDFLNMQLIPMINREKTKEFETLKNKTRILK